MNNSMVVISIINSTMILVWDILMFFLYILFLVLIAGGSSIAVYYGTGFQNVQMMYFGYLMMPLAASQQKLAPGAINQANKLETTLNDLFVDIANEIIQCAEILADLWNRVVAFILGLAWHVGDAFGLNLPQWEVYARMAQTARMRIPKYSTLVTMAEEIDRQLEKEGLDIGSGKYHAQLLAIEARARLIAIRIARTMDPTGERNVFTMIIQAICDVVRTVIKFVVNLLTNVIEFVLTLADFIIDLLGPLFDGDVLTFAQVLVKLIINIILSILDPCNCFGGFPQNFPKSIFKCVCFPAYHSDNDVPNNIFNALVGCFCPGFNLFGDVLNDMIYPCFRVDVMRFLLNLYNTLIDIVMGAISTTQALYKQVVKLINSIGKLADNITDLFRRDVEWECGNDEWCRWKVYLHPQSDGDFDIHFTRTRNSTGEIIDEHRSSLRAGTSQRTRKMHIKLIEDMGDFGLADAEAMWAQLRQNSNREVEFAHSMLKTHTMIMQQRSEALFRTGDRLREAHDARDDLMFSEVVRASLPTISCPLPIDPGRTAFDSLRSAEAGMRWSEKLRLANNYFTSHIGERLHYAAARAVLDIYGSKFFDESQGFRHSEFIARNNATCTMTEAEWRRRSDYLRAHETRSSPDGAAFLRALKGVVQEFLLVLTSRKAMTPKQIYEDLKSVPIAEGVNAVNRVGERIRKFHGWADDLEIKCDMCATALLNPAQLPLLARRYGKRNPENFRHLEDVLDSIEGVVTHAETAREAFDRGDKRGAARIVAENILQDRIPRFAYLAHGVARSGRVRVVGIAVGVGFAAGGVLSLSIGLIIGLATLAAPLLGLLMILLAILGVPLMMVIINLASTSLQTMFAGGEPAGFDPIASLIKLVGPIIYDMFTEPDPPTLHTLEDFISDVFDLQVDNLEHIATLLLRTALTLLFPFIKPPEPGWDAETGASTEGISSWVLNRISCDTGVFCTISAGEKNANSLGECACYFEVDGDDFTRLGTYKEPCPPHTGRTICYPFYRTGRFVNGVDIIPGDAPKCSDFGYEEEKPMLWPQREDFWQIIGTWYKNWLATSTLIFGLLAAGWTIPLEGLAAYPVQSMCPCARPFASPVTRLTIYTQVLALFWPQVAEWFYNLLNASTGVWLIGGYFKSIIPLFTPLDPGFDEWYCGIMYGGSWFFMTGVLYTAVPFISVLVILSIPIFAWFFWRIILWPVNIFFFVLASAYWFSQRRTARGFVDTTWRDPYITSDLPDRMVEYVLPRRPYFMPESKKFEEFS